MPGDTFRHLFHDTDGHGSMEKFPHLQKLKQAYRSSIVAKMTASVLKSLLLVGIVLFIIGLSLYGTSLVDRYVAESFGLARSSAAIADRIVNTDSMISRVMEIYREVPEEVRMDPESERYKSYFRGLQEEADYKILSSTLEKLRRSSDVDFLYMAVYDKETNALVYICDPDKNESTSFTPGQWEPIEQREMDKFTSWNGKGKLYDIGPVSRYHYMCTSGYPVGDPDDDVYAYVLADVTIGGVFQGIRRLIAEYALAIILIMVLVGIELDKRMKTVLLDPLNNIGQAAISYVDDRNAGLKNTDHFDNLNIHTGDEIEELSVIMADMEHNIGAHEEALVKLTAENEKAHTEMNLAARIQMNMLPRVFPAFPDRHEFCVYASMDPAKEVGGDFYDFFLIDDDHLCLIIADVAGKGIPAALFMMSSMIILNNTALSGSGYDAGAILKDANNLINIHNSEDMFVTVWIGILDLKTGVMRASNAGHEYPAIKQPGGKFELLKDKHGFVLGTMENMKYSTYELKLEPGSKIFVYTDGAPEATTLDNEMFGTDRIIETLNKDPEAHPKKILESMQTAIDEFVGEAPQFDDLTMLCIEYKGPSDKGAGPEHSGEKAQTGMRKFRPRRQKTQWH